MRQALKLHPDSRCLAVTNIEVEATRSRPGLLLLRYFVTATISDLRLPPVTATARADELWRQTCFEAFLRVAPGGVYYEFNFAPSTLWAAYRFSDYRRGISAVGAISAPRIEVQSDDAGYQLQALLELHRLPGLPSNRPWRLGLSAVIEETSGGKSYWALAHAPGKADFHHADCFAQELPAA